MNLRLGGELRILDFDIEARPLSYLGADFTTREVTAIAAAWIVNGKCGKVHVRCLTRKKLSGPKMLDWFRGLYDEADMVTGHYIRGYDLPNVNAALAEFGMPLLTDKLSHDTKNDLVKFTGVSKSQESLGAMLGLTHPKVQMSQDDWRAANRLTNAGIAKTKERVVGDVVQHVEMREVLMERGLLGRPRVWRPSPSGVGKYQP